MVNINYLIIDIFKFKFSNILFKMSHIFSVFNFLNFFCKIIILWFIPFKGKLILYLNII